jgi:hypothetical protein
MWRSIVTSDVIDDRSRRFVPGTGLVHQYSFMQTLSKLPVEMTKAVTS